MTTKELSEKELRIYDKLAALQGTMQEKQAIIESAGIFDEYMVIHDQYLEIAKFSNSEEERNESIKRICFLEWVQGSEPSCFTGIWNLNAETIIDSYMILCDRIKAGKIDNELKWMLYYYHAENFMSLSSEDKTLVNFIKNLDPSFQHKPDTQELRKTMIDRGQMGKWFLD